ncbi:kelch repeat-containing protein [Salipiger bermudensis]|uniref:kelch repeat-containing protein n=1 Tax=Salipiger bermudensis TaxID=344736 RepID=UPI001CD392F9|nr:kelch motif-containing protein [Salipiger bermudensis]
MLGGRIYLAGGLSWENEELISVEIYDPATDRWETRPDVPALPPNARSTSPEAPEPTIAAKFVFSGLPRK